MSIAIITGASSGIGEQFVRELAERRLASEFWLVARRAERMEALAEELGINAKIIPADLTSGEGIEKIREALESERPEVGFLINAAGFGNFGRFDELPESDMERMIDLNVKALVTITNLTVPFMTRGSRVIQLGSGSCFTPLYGFNVYAASKAFVLHYSKALYYELGERGIYVTCFCPGWVDTEFIGKALSRADVTRPKRMWPLLSCRRVVRGCVRASLKGRKMYVTNWFTRLQHLLFKLLPDGILSRAWIMMQRKGGSKNEESKS
ncbi:MAG: SDR family NAD(P)-dependent oxidoreductase [Clostridia bacterium]|nr:SDR family NAD(P)-dependent oxidoreductase [Clostridia bacterium]